MAQAQNFKRFKMWNASGSFRIFGKAWAVSRLVVLRRGSQRFLSVTEKLLNPGELTN